MKILAVEDEPLFADALLMMLDELGYDQVQIADNATDALRLFVAFAPDIVLMDIKIKGNQDGIEVAESMQAGKNIVPIIFMTSVKDKDTFERAKQTNPIGYLIKPFDEETLERNIELAIYKHHKATWDTELFTTWNNDVLAEDSLFVKNKQRLERIYIRDIVHVVADAKYIELHMKGGKVLASVSMNDLLNKLPTQHFVRIKRNQIINTQYIENIDLKAGIVLMSTGEEASIGRSYREEFLNRLKIV